MTVTAAPLDPNGPVEAPAGLEGVIASRTRVGDVRGREGFYHYGPYDAVALNRQRSYEDVWHLMLYGHLPSKAEQLEFASVIAPLRELPPDLMPELRAIASLRPFTPLAALRTAISWWAQSNGLRSWLDVSRPEVLDWLVKVTSVTPTLMTALFRLSQGMEPIQPRPQWSTPKNYLWMMTGIEPGEAQVWAIERYLISTIDHGFNSSTFTARVITSTGADVGSAIVGAIGALSGPLHGGAPSRALDMLDAIGSPERAEDWIRTSVANGDRIMGFGHRVYKGEDPRSTLLRDVAQQLGGSLAQFAAIVEQTIIEVLAELKPGRELNTNVEFYAGVVMDACGVPREMFTPTFACSRVIGWSAHILEQIDNNRLIRPSSLYVGDAPPQPVPSID